MASTYSCLERSVSGIVDAQDEGAARLPRDQPVQKCGTQIADMDETGWRRRESGDGHGDLLIGSASFI